MNVFILRHAEAEPRGSGVAEADRKLTPHGKEELKKILRRARAAGVSPELILTSPWTRALDTARIAQKALSSGDLLETKTLLPDVAPAQVWKEIRTHGTLKNLMLVGHEPQLGRIAAFLLGASLEVDLKKAGMIRVEVQDRSAPPLGILKWMLTPKLASDD